MNGVLSLTRRVRPCAVLALLVLARPGMPLGKARADGPSTGAAGAQVRQPAALCLSRDGSRLFVANRKSGTLAIVAPGLGRVVGEFEAGRGLADVAALPDGRHVLAVDQEGDALLLMEVRDDAARVVGRLAVSADPVGLAVAPDGASCAVSSLDSRHLTFLDLGPAGPDDRPDLRVVRGLDLPFSPRNLAYLKEGTKLVVADAFGGALAVVDAGTGALESVRNLPAHNIRGLAASPDGRTLVVSHQVLRRQARTHFEDVFWGSLIGNQVRALRADAVLSPGSDADLTRDGLLADLGSAGVAAGDPAGVAFGASGKVVVALAGVDEVAFGPVATGRLRRVGVGRRPTAVVASPDGRLAYVADTFGETVSVVDLTVGLWLRAIRLGPPPALDSVGRGERLFYDSRISLDGWMSCHSCHTDGRTNGLLSDTLGDDSYGTPKRIPSLLGVGSTGPWMWDGSARRLEDQVRKSIETSMRGRSPTDEQVADLTAYLRSLAPPRPLASADPEAVARGRRVFEARKCAGCHAPPEYTSPGRYDVGLADETGQDRFNPPSLRGVGLRRPLLHDGRAGTLDDVFLRHRHPRDAAMSPEEAADLIAFLKTL